jgi:hypothetical protein
MKSETINQWVSLGANIGVILGILLLAFELNQNNKLLEAQISADHRDTRLSSTSIAHDERLAEIAVKYRSQQPLSDTEQSMLNEWYLEAFIVWEWEWREMIAGRFDVNIEGWILSFSKKTPSGELWYPKQVEQWEYWKDQFDPEFIKFMDKNIVSQL